MDEAEDLAHLAMVTFPLACPPSSAQEDIAHFIASQLSAARFAEYIADPLRTVLHLRNDGEPGGYCILVRGSSSDSRVRAVLTWSPTIELSKFYVHPDHHGRGAAAALMKASLELAAADGARGMWLGVNNENLRAARFYGKCGFEKVGTKTFRLGNRVEQDFVLERSLAV